MADTRASSSLAVRHLAQVFTNILATDRTMTFEQFESKAIEVGHVVIAKAMAAALEQHDQDLCADLPDGQRIHDVRRRTLVTEVGDVSFRYTTACATALTGAPSSLSPTRSSFPGTVRYRPAPCHFSPRLPRRSHTRKLPSCSRAKAGRR